MIYAILSVNKDSEKLNVLLGGIKGILGADLSVVNFDNIAVICSETKRAELIADKSNAIEYAGVIEKLAQHFTLLPMRFGSMMESTYAIIQMLERNYNDIQQNLLKVENMWEFGLKVFCDPEKLKADLSGKSDIPPSCPVEPVPEVQHSIYRDWVNKKLKEHRIEEMLLTYVNSVIAEITGYLTRLNAVNKFKKMASTTNIIDAVFLLDKDNKDALIHAVSDLQNRHSGLSFMLTGPWPPYNFVDFTVK